VNNAATLALNRCKFQATPNQGRSQDFISTEAKW